MGILESTPEQPRTPVEVRARPQPKPQLTQAQQLEAAEKKIYELMQQVVSFLATHPVFTLKEAQNARFVVLVSVAVTVFNWLIRSSFIWFFSLLV